MTVGCVMTDVSVKLGSVQALNAVSLTIKPGQFLALLGPSGSGKTTTLNVLGGFIRPDSGTVTFGDRDMGSVPPRKRDIGIVFQGYALFPHMSVGDNIAFPLRMRGVARDERDRRVREVLEFVELAAHADRPVRTLSGGQQQRVALARAVVFNPRMLLLDEPLAALDKQLRESMQHELKRFQQKLGITTVAVTHDQVEALTMAETVGVMRDGRIEQIAPPTELYLQPKTLFVASFLGEANVMPVSRGELHGFGRLPNQAVSGHAVIRPEHLKLGELTSDARLGAAATIEEVSFQGARLRIRVRLQSLPSLSLTVTESSQPLGNAFHAGQSIEVWVRRDAVHVIPDEILQPAPVKLDEPTAPGRPPKTRI